MHSKRKILDWWRTGWKAKAWTSFALYLKVFKPFVLSLACKSVVYSCLLNHVYQHSFRSITEATEKFPGGGSNGPIMGPIWTAFRPREGEFEKNFSKNSNARGLSGGMFKLRFDWYISTWLQGDQIRTPRVVITSFFFVSLPFPRRFIKDCRTAILVDCRFLCLSTFCSSFRHDRIYVYLFALVSEIARPRV